MKKNYNSNLPFYKQPKFKYSAVATTLIAVFVVCVVALNILATVITQKTTALTLDLSANQNFSLSKENIEYIKQVDKEVKIIVTATREYYENGGYYNQLSNQYVDETGGKYFAQTVKLLDNYPKINDKVSVEYIDAASPEFLEYYNKYSSTGMEVGDLIVESTFVNSKGKEQSRYRILSHVDLYEVGEQTGMSSATTATYSIKGSQFESKVTSALFYVTQEQQDLAVILTGYGTSDINAFSEVLKNNNYDIQELSDLTTQEIPAQADVLVLPAPMQDLTTGDVKKIDEFLLGSTDEKGNKVYSKNLLYFASSDQADIPNVDNLLNEWGIEFGSGTVYESDGTNHEPNAPTSFGIKVSDKDFVDGLNTNAVSFIGSRNRPMSLKFSESGRYEVKEILKTSDTTIVMPYGENENEWTPTNQAKQSYSSVILSSYKAAEDKEKGTLITSNVIAVSSVDLVSDDFITRSYILTDELMVSLTNFGVNRDSKVYTVTNKTINRTIFQPTQTTSDIVFTVGTFVIPILIILFGMFVFIRRKRRQ